MSLDQYVRMSCILPRSLICHGLSCERQQHMGRLKMFHLNMMQASQVVTIVLISLSTNMNLVFFPNFAL